MCPGQNRDLSNDAFAPTATSIASIRNCRFTSIRVVAQTSQMRKKRSFRDGMANGAIDLSRCPIRGFGLPGFLFPDHS
jgi:hypothetical protein